MQISIDICIYIHLYMCFLSYLRGRVFWHEPDGGDGHAAHTV